jgi:transcriptional regulator with XRE-family HTH domain
MMHSTYEQGKSLDPEIFKRRLLHGRYVLDLRYRDLADLTGLSRRVICELAEGRMLPRPTQVQRLAEVLGVRPEWLAGLVD